MATARPQSGGTGRVLDEDERCIRMSYLLKRRQVKEIIRTAERSGVTQSGVVRWLIDLGLEAAAAGDPAAAPPEADPGP